MFNYQKLSRLNYFLLKFTSLLIVTCGINISLSAKAIAPIAKLSAQEQAILNQGQVILKGKRGDYTGQVLAIGSVDTAWQVLTDYNNFNQFLPNVPASKVIVDEGDRKIFEQTNAIDLWFFTEEFTVQIEARETKPQKIDFKLFKGDLKHLSGTWSIQRINAKQIKVTHTVKVEPQSNTEKPFFYGIYESTLEKTLAAIATEITNRSQTK